MSGRVPHDYVGGRVPHDYMSGRVPHDYMSGRVPHDYVSVCAGIMVGGHAVIYSYVICGTLQVSGWCRGPAGAGLHGRTGKFLNPHAMDKVVCMGEHPGMAVAGSSIHGGRTGKPSWAGRGACCMGRTGDPKPSWMDREAGGWREGCMWG